MSVKCTVVERLERISTVHQERSFSTAWQSIRRDMTFKSKWVIEVHLLRSIK